MTPIDQQMYEMFSDKTLKKNCLIVYSRYSKSDVIYTEYDEDKSWDYPKPIEIIGHPPQLHDVFGLAKERNWIMNADDSRICIAKYPEPGNHYIPCDTSIPLLKFDDDTKSAIISLFK